MRTQADWRFEYCPGLRIREPADRAVSLEGERGSRTGSWRARGENAGIGTDYGHVDCRETALPAQHAYDADAADAMPYQDDEPHPWRPLGRRLADLRRAVGYTGKTGSRGTNGEWFQPVDKPNRAPLASFPGTVEEP